MQSPSFADHDASTGNHVVKGTCSSRSRSTSPGSSLIQSDSLPSSTKACRRPAAVSNLADSEEGCRAPYSVRNTFIDCTMEGSLRPDARLHERDILSCPASRIGMMSLPQQGGFEGFDTAAEAAAATVSVALLPSSTPPSMMQQFALGSPEMPTIGSSEHASGLCKPCSFFHKNGCENGVQCTFCHLCEPNEKRRRQKGKKTQLRQRLLEQKAQQLVTDVLAELFVTVSPCTGALPLDAVVSRMRPTLSSSEDLCHMPYGVKNTFVEMPVDGSMLPPQRSILSCPASRIGCMRLPKPPALDLYDLGEGLDSVPVATPQPWPVTPSECWPATLPPTPVDENVIRTTADSLMYLDSLGLDASWFSMPATAPPVEYAPWLWQPAVPPPPPTVAADDLDHAPWLWQPAAVPPPPPTTAADDVAEVCASYPFVFQTSERVEIMPTAKSSASVLRLADSVPVQQPELGTVEMPTVGSVNHYTGNCKPCAFLYKQGCDNGVHCTFCHLCDPSEKKRRQKSKKMQLQSMKREAASAGPIGGPR